MQNHRTSSWLDALTTALGPVIWGSTYIVTTELLPPDRPFTAALLRTLPAGLLLVSWCRRWPAWGDWVGWRRLLGLAFTGGQLRAGGIMLAPVAWVVGPPLPALSATQVGGYVYLSLAGALLAYALWFRGIARLPSVAVSSLGLLSPVTAVLLGWVLLGQAMTGVALGGMLVVLASILAVQWAMSRPVQG